VHAEFAGDRPTEGGPLSGSLTWGQRAIWNVVTAMAPHDAFLNLTRVVELPAPTPHAVATALGALVSRHESLRTRVVPGPGDGEVQQVLSGTGRLPLQLVTVAEADAEAAAHAQARSLAARSFDIAGDWPLRAALVLVRDRVRYLVVVFSHLAVDWYATEILVHELRRLVLRGAPAGTAHPVQPLDVAARERLADPTGTRRVVDYWLARYREAPRELLPVDVSAGPPRYRQARLTSPAVDAAARRLAARYRVSTSTVLLAGTAQVLAQYAGQPTCPLLTTVNNRHQQEHRDLVAPVNQLGLLTLSVADGSRGEPVSLDRLVPRAWSAALRAYRHSYYDQAALDRALTGAGLQAGAYTEPYCCFNDARLPSRRDRPGRVPDAAQVAEALAGSTVGWLPDLPRLNWRFSLDVRDTHGSLALTLAADTRCLPGDAVVRFLETLESRLVDAAVRPDAP
jgi:Condensation domain